MIVQSPHPDDPSRTYRQYAFPVKMSDYAFTIDRPPPQLGEHNEEVLTALGLDAEQIIGLRVKRVV